MANRPTEKECTEENESFILSFHIPHNKQATKCLIVGIFMSVALILLQILCVVLTVQSINNLQNSDSSYSTPAYDGYQKQVKLPTIPCNQSSPCSVVEDDTYTKLFTIFGGIRHQSLIRNNNKGIPRFRIWQNCEEFTLLNSSGSFIIWTGNIYGSRGVTIKENSTYGVHSMFTFKYPYGNTRNISGITHRINIERGTHNGSNAVFERSVVLEPRTDAFKTSTIFDFVYLYAGDRVYPSLSDTSFLYNMKQANVWGIFPVI